MRVLIHLSAICVTLLTVGQAGAATYDRFSVGGTFTDPFKDTLTLSGSFDVNAKSGIIADASFNLVGEPWTQILSQGSLGTLYEISVQTPVLNSGCSPQGGPGCHDILNLVFSQNPLMLLHDAGGSIVGGFAYLRDAGFTTTLVSGTVSATPLPLFAWGLGALGLFGFWHKKRKVAQTVA
jgi:hypothetical protein